jgi:hypothetical protein
MKFKQLIDIIRKTHFSLQQGAVSAVDRNLTVRNWLIGFYIAEFEQNGEDRAVYGDKLIDKIAESVKHIKGLSARNLNLFRQFYFTRNLNLFRQFYFTYPQIMQTVSAELRSSDLGKFEVNFKRSTLRIVQTLSAQLQQAENKELIGVPLNSLITNLSFSQFAELIRLDDTLKRAFYEIECIKGNYCSITPLDLTLRSDKLAAFSSTYASNMARLPGP